MEEVLKLQIEDLYADGITVCKSNFEHQIKKLFNLKIEEFKKKTLYILKDYLNIGKYTVYRLENILICRSKFNLQTVMLTADDLLNSFFYFKKSK